MKDDKKIQSFIDLDVWKKSHRLVLMVYKLIQKLPSKEQFVLGNQMSRAAISITSNIAEGFSRESYKDKIRFYYIARGSLTELQNQLLIAKDLSYITNKKFKEIADQTVEVHKLINGIIKKSKTKF